MEMNQTILGQVTTLVRQFRRRNGLMFFNSGKIELEN
jgi:hypothetical protein